MKLINFVLMIVLFSGELGLVIRVVLRLFGISMRMRLKRLWRGLMVFVFTSFYLIVLVGIFLLYNII